MSKLFGDIFSKFYNDPSVGFHIDEAKKSLEPFLLGDDLSGKTFLDAGCGGGLFSVAAHRLNASAITSFDNDSKMLSFCSEIKSREGFEAHWQILEGSILDLQFVKSLGSFDYVYCWGVVHHTGDMWKAIENIISVVKSGGCIYLGVYNNASAFGFWDDRRFGSSKFWYRVKKMIYLSPKFIKKAALLISLFFYRLVSATDSMTGGYKFKNFHERGMTGSVAIQDWLFGFPYEFASVDEVVNYMIGQGFRLERIDSNIGLRTNHYLFQKV